MYNKMKPDIKTSFHFTPEQYKRYSRHLMLSGIGRAGQIKLLQARVLLIGAGGLGSPAALYLAAAGVGHIGLVDFDKVELSNLQRQIIHSNAGVGSQKSVSAKNRIQELNPDVDVQPIEARLTSENALDIISQYDLVIDGSDNFPTRYLVNDACVMQGKPNVYGAVLQFEGQASLFIPKQGPCYRCLFPEPPPPHLVPTCAEAGVLGAVPGIIGSIQASEAIKLILNKGESLAGRLLTLDAMNMTFRELRVKRDPDCAVCGDHPRVTELIDYEGFCGLTPESDEAEAVEQVGVQQLKEKLDARDDFLLLDVREEQEYELAKIQGARQMTIDELFGAGMDELSAHKDKEIWLLCHVGERSRLLCRYLKSRGFSNLKNVAGGIEAWATHIDPTLPRY